MTSPLCTFCDAPATTTNRDGLGRDPVPSCEAHASGQIDDGWDYESCRALRTARAWANGHGLLTYFYDVRDVCPDAEYAHVQVEEIGGVVTGNVGRIVYQGRTGDRFDAYCYGYDQAAARWMPK